MLLAARLAFAAWLALALLVMQIGLSLFITPADLWLLHRNAFATILFLVIAFSFGYLVAAFGVKCAICGHRIFIEHPGQKHANSTRVWFMDRWASAVVELLRFGHCTCMYCGSTLQVRPL